MLGKTEIIALPRGLSGHRCDRASIDSEQFYFHDMDFSA